MSSEASCHSVIAALAFSLLCDEIRSWPGRGLCQSKRERIGFALKTGFDLLLVRESVINRHIVCIVERECLSCSRNASTNLIQGK